jgi:hypothetical protein
MHTKTKTRPRPPVTDGAVGRLASVPWLHSPSIVLSAVNALPSAHTLFVATTKDLLILNGSLIPPYRQPLDGSNSSFDPLVDVMRPLREIRKPD